MANYKYKDFAMQLKLNWRNWQKEATRLALKALLTEHWWLMQWTRSRGWAILLFMNYKITVPCKLLENKDLITLNCTLNPSTVSQGFAALPSQSLSWLWQASNYILLVLVFLLKIFRIYSLKMYYFGVPDNFDQIQLENWKKTKNSD